MQNNVLQIGDGRAFQHKSLFGELNFRLPQNCQAETKPRLLPMCCYGLGFFCRCSRNPYLWVNKPVRLAVCSAFYDFYISNWHWGSMKKFFATFGASIFFFFIVSCLTCNANFQFCSAVITFMFKWFTVSDCWCYIHFLFFLVVVVIIIINITNNK